MKISTAVLVLIINCVVFYLTDTPIHQSCRIFTQRFWSPQTGEFDCILLFWEWNYPTMQCIHSWQHIIFNCTTFKSINYIASSYTTLNYITFGTRIFPVTVNMSFSKHQNRTQLVAFPKIVVCLHS